MRLPLCAFSVPILSRDNTIGWSALPKHLPQVPSERVRPFKRSKVAALLVRGLEDDFAHRVDPSDHRVRKDDRLKETAGEEKTHEAGSLMTSPGKNDTPMGTEDQRVPA